MCWATFNCHVCLRSVYCLPLNEWSLLNGLLQLLMGGTAVSLSCRAELSDYHNLIPGRSTQLSESRLWCISWQCSHRTHSLVVRGTERTTITVCQYSLCCPWLHMLVSNPQERITAMLSLTFCVPLHENVTHYTQLAQTRSPMFYILLVNSD